MSNNYTQGSGAAGGNNSSGHRRERDVRTPNASGFNGTGALPVVNAGRGYTGSFDFDEMIFTLHELFAQDRQVASQQDSRRCGICYLYFGVTELYYREEEGFYVCSNCERTLGKQNVPMIRRQQK